MKLKLFNIMEAIWLLVLIAFMIKGFLSDIGYATKFKPEEIYTFSYIAFAMSGYLFCDKIVYSIHREE